MSCESSFLNLILFADFFFHFNSFEFHASPKDSYLNISFKFMLCEYWRIIKLFWRFLINKIHPHLLRFSAIKINSKEHFTLSVFMFISVITLSFRVNLHTHYTTFIHSCIHYLVHSSKRIIWKIGSEEIASLWE